MKALVGRLPLGWREVLDSGGERFDMCGGCAAAAAEICGAGGDELRSPGSELVGLHGEDRLAVFQARHSGVWEDADGHRAVVGKRLDDGDEFLRAE